MIHVHADDASEGRKERDALPSDGAGADLALLAPFPNSDIAIQVSIGGLLKYLQSLSLLFNQVVAPYI